MAEPRDTSRSDREDTPKMNKERRIRGEPTESTNDWCCSLVTRCIIILLCLRWYFRFKLSYRDLVAILGERGLSISHTTILRWVIRYAETCGKRWSRFERQVGGSWRVDETFIKVRGQLMYLYRAVDGQGNTVEFFLSRTRGIAAAEAFFRKALKHHREPHSITLDGHRPSHSALRRMAFVDKAP